MPYNKCLEQGSAWSRCSINICTLPSYLTPTHQLAHLPIPDVEYHVMLVAHGHNVLHTGGEGHTGYAVLVAQHLCHLTLFIHIPDAHSRPVSILGEVESLLLLGSAPGRARGAGGAEVGTPPRCAQKPPPPSVMRLSWPRKKLFHRCPRGDRRNGLNTPPHPVNHDHNSPPPSLCTSHQGRRPEHSETSWGQKRD